jgi:hypothetical protein
MPEIKSGTRLVAATTMNNGRKKGRKGEGKGRKEGRRENRKEGGKKEIKVLVN